MHEVLKVFPCSFDGIHSENLQVGDERDFGSMAEGLKKAGLIGDIGGEKKPAGGTELRDDGPTVAEYVANGYLAVNYPPQGYAPRSTEEEIEAAIKAQEAKGSENTGKAAEVLRGDFAKLTVAQLREKAAESKVEIPDDARKDDIIGTLIAASAPQA